MKFLLDCTRKKRTYRHILIIMNRLIKKRLYEFIMSLFINELMNVMQRKIFFAYELFAIMIKNRNIQFVVEFWKRICKKYEINIKFSSTHHLETDEQIKNVNKIMKNHLLAYVTYAENDWINYFSNAEFAINNHTNVFIDIISFFANHEYYFRTEAKFFESYEENRKMKVQKTNEIIQKQILII